MRTHRLLPISIVLALAFSVSALAQRQAARPPRDIEYPASVTFADRLADAISSDGGGAYSVGVVFHSVTGDLVIHDFSGARYLHYDYRTRVSGNGPVGETEGDINMGVRGILDMSPGDSRDVGASFTTAIFGILNPVFRFNPTLAPGATLVHVVRNLDGTWTVTADEAGGSDLAGLLQTKGNKTTLLGIYSMPFQLTIECPTCA